MGDEPETIGPDLHASSSTVRDWWSDYECDPALMVKVSFPGEGRTWDLLVAAESVDAWEMFALIMDQFGYLFRESAGGTYNCRQSTVGGDMSVHSYGVALDLNPKSNPMAYPVRHDYPPGFVDAVKSVHTVGRADQVFLWGGDWPDDNPPDAMHWQINVSPDALAVGVAYEGIEDMTGPADWTPDDVARFEAIVNNMIVKNTDKNLAWHLRHGIAPEDPATTYAAAAEGPDGDD